MRTLTEIRQAIERASERRADVWHLLSEAYDTALARELKALDGELAQLWEEQRVARARVRFGERARIVARARAEERIDRAA